MSGFSTAVVVSVVVTAVEGSRVDEDFVVVRESGGGVVVNEVGVEGVSSESESLEGSSGRVP